MFRTNALSEMSIYKFGVGSIIKAERGEEWLVVGSEGMLSVVSLLYLPKMELLCESGTTVIDRNYLTEAEARDLVCKINKPYTFSDFELDSMGIKQCRD